MNAVATRKQRNKSVKTEDFVLIWEDKEIVRDAKTGQPVMDEKTGKPKLQKMGKVNSLDDFCKITGMEPASASSRASAIRNQKSIPLRSLTSVSTGRQPADNDFLRTACEQPS